MELMQHPLSAAFPAMSADDFQALKDDIDNNGQREPVTVLDGMVLDGWHRYRACVELGIKPTQFTFGAEDDPVAFVKTVNLHRRHMTETQRAEAVIACSAWAPPHRLKNKQTPVSTSTKTNAEMAAEARVSVGTIKNAKAGHQAGLGEAMKDGAITAKEAATVARGITPKAPAPPKAAPTASAPTDDGPDAAELAATERAAAEEIAALMKLAAADDKLAAAMDEAKRLRALNRVLQERNNGLMGEKNILIKRVESLQRKVDKLEKAGAPA